MTPSEIRNLTVTLLTGSTNAGIRVHNTMVTAKHLENLPAIAVFYKSVQASNESARGITLKAAGVISIDVLTSSTVNWADAADVIVEQIKTTLFSSQAWLDAINGLSGYSVEYALINTGEIPIATAMITINSNAIETYNPI